MKPILYAAEETQFETNGIGMLADAISCIVEETLNGAFELQMEYPIGGLRYADISERMIILAKANPYDDPQPFRIYNIAPTLTGRIHIRARHISYDLSGIVVDPFVASSAPEAFMQIKQCSVTSHPFNFETDISSGTPFPATTPTSVRSMLGGTKGSILDTYGGEYEFDRFQVKLHRQRGEDRGVAIRYGKNLTDFRQEKNCANVYTGVYPFWKSPEGSLVTLPEKIINAEGNYSFQNIKLLDLSEAFEEQPAEAMLREYTTEYIRSNKIGVPQVSWSISFVDLDKTEEYKGVAILERIWLGDTVGVMFPKLQVNTCARCIKTSYNVLADRYEKIELGSLRANLADTIVSQQQELEKKPSVSMVEKISAVLTATIMGAKGGAVRLLDTDGDGLPDTIYVADSADPASAIKVWRWNYEGWAASKTGYSGPFVLGATLENGILADAVTAAHLVAGTIKSADGNTFYLDLNEGVLKGNFSELTVQSKTVDAIAKAEAKEAVSNQSQSDVFDKLTNGGQAQGVYLLDGQIYINASYLATGVIRSADGTVEIDLANNTVTIKTDTGRLVLSSSGLYGYGEESLPSLVLKPGTGSGTATLLNSLSAEAGLTVAAGKADSTLTLGQPGAHTDIRGKTVTVMGKVVSWVENSDGTYTLKGT